MRKKLFIILVGLLMIIGLSSCDTLMVNTTPVYYDYYPRTTVVIPGRPLPPPPPRYIHRPIQKPHTPPPPPRRGRH